MAHYNKHEAQEWAWENLRGQWTTLITPFTQDKQIDEAGARHNIRHIRRLGTRGGGCTWGMGDNTACHKSRVKSIPARG